MNFETTPTFTLTVQATDNGTPALSGSNTITVNLTNVNEAPVVNAAGPFTIAENSANGTTVGTVSATDPDAGQTRSFSLTGGNTNGAFAINSSTGIITVANSAALNFETTPTFTLTVQATDNGTPVLSGSRAVVVNLTNVNEAPVAGVNSYTVQTGTTLTVAAAGVLVNDSDPDAGTTLTAVLGTTTANGTLALNANGSFTYTPNAGFTGTDSFTYQASDGLLTSPLTTVTLTVTTAPTSGFTVTPATMAFTGTVNGANQQSSVTVTNNGTTAMTVTWTDPISWLIAITPTSAQLTLQPGQSGTFTLTARMTGLAAVSYSGTATLTGGGVTKQLPVTLTVLA